MLLDAVQIVMLGGSATAAADEAATSASKRDQHASPADRSLLESLLAGASERASRKRRELRMPLVALAKLLSECADSRLLAKSARRATLRTDGTLRPGGNGGCGSRAAPGAAVQARRQRFAQLCSRLMGAQRWPPLMRRVTEVSDAREAA